MIFWSEVYGPASSPPVVVKNGTNGTSAYLNGSINGHSVNGDVASNNGPDDNHLNGSSDNGLNGASCSTGEASASVSTDTSDIDSIGNPFSYLFKLLRPTDNKQPSGVPQDSLQTQQPSED